MQIDPFERVTCRVEFQMSLEKLDCAGRSVTSREDLTPQPDLAAAERAAKNAGFKKKSRQG